MSTLRAITLRLGQDDYDRLQAEAARLGVPPATLVRMYVRDHFNSAGTELEGPRRTGLDALDRLSRLTADLPAVDAVEIARKSREVLDARPSF